MSWIALAVGLYLAWTVALYLGQRNMIFVGRTLPAPPDPAPGPGVEIWWLPTSGGEVEAWYHPPARGGRDGAEGVSPPATGDPGSDPASVRSRPVPALVFAHGNGERIDDWTGAFRPLADRGVAVLLVEYPGYGRSEGVPTEASVTETMIAAYDRLAARPEVDPARIVGLGRSLGGGAVAVLSRHRPLRALVLQSTFTSVRTFAARYLVPSFLVRDPFDALQAVGAFEGPVLVAHGLRDQVIPYAHGERLAAAAVQGRLVTWPCGHNDCPLDWGAWLDELMDFLAAHDIHPNGEGS